MAAGFSLGGVYKTKNLKAEAYQAQRQREALRGKAAKPRVVEINTY